MTAAPDAAVRRRALDPTRSFVVQAPAGSGKTELLIQRYLTMLARVREPEQVVAVSFTRKSAAEMRGRVVDLLRRAAAGSAPDRAHRGESLALARAVVERDRALGWSLVAQPRRLRIDTVDALNAWLGRQLPVLSGAVAGARVAEDAGALYLRAARQCVDRLDEDGELGPALRHLLAAVDNSLPALERALADMLPQRDQWLGVLGLAMPEALRDEVEDALRTYTETVLARVETEIDTARLARLTGLLRRLGDHGAGKSGGLEHWRDPDLANAAPEIRLAAWQAAVRVLLTQQGAWRRKFGRAQGFGSALASERTAMDELRAELELRAGLAETLSEVARLPAPTLVPGEAHSLDAARIALKHVLAELHVLFQRLRTVDFPELAFAAQHALGAVDAPSELLLALDRRIEHILVDEFQDTSHSQFALLELLTAGWTEGDGRTLFLVGDPMQSIYRFRDADMSLFLAAAARGIGPVRCEHVVLHANFRAAPAVVAWINEAFAGIFPDSDAFDSGSARYHRCEPAREPEAGQHVDLLGVDGTELGLEHDRVLEILERELARDPGQSIGVLVQNRNHLAGLQARLRARGWPAHVVDVESLAQHQLGQDLLGLTRALAHPADRVAWLAVLHAPWCGLSWRDLHALCGDRPQCAVWALMHDAAQLARLGADGRQRLCRLRDGLQKAFERRAAAPFSRWVEATWRRLGGPACIRDTSEGELASRFFALLDGAANEGGIDDPAVLEEAFSNPAGQGTAPRGTGIEIMTIHRAKGLEFDSVIVFGLARSGRTDRKRAIEWHELRDASGRSRLLLAPLAAGTDRLGAFIRRLNRRFDRAEQARLLYVAATRARERLYLVAGLDPAGDPPRRGTLLDWLWPAFGAEFRRTCRPRSPAGAAAAVASELERLPLARMPQETAADEPGDAVPTAARPERPPFEWAGPAAVHIGTLVHRELRRIGEHGLGSGSRDEIAAALGRYRRELALMGVPAGELEDAARRVGEVLRRVIDDERGRWLLAPHAEAGSELRLTVPGALGLEHVMLDRTFVTEDGVRWIVDYKTSEHTGGDLEGFLDSEVERYRAQLERYGAAMAAIDRRPIRLALYFPLLTAFRDWPAGITVP